VLQSTSSAADNYSANEARPRFHCTHLITTVVTKVRQGAIPGVNSFQSHHWNPQNSQIIQAHIYKPLHTIPIIPIPILSSHPRTGFRVPPPLLPPPTQPLGTSTRVCMHFTCTVPPLYPTCIDYLILSDSCYCLYYWGFHSSPCSSDGPLFKESYLGVRPNSVWSAKCHRFLQTITIRHFWKHVVTFRLSHCGTKHLQQQQQQHSHQQDSNRREQERERKTCRVQTVECGLILFKKKLRAGWS